MTSRQLEVSAYMVLALGLAGTWGFTYVALSGGTATVPSTLGLYTMTAFSFGLAAAGTRWMRVCRSAVLWLLAVWAVGLTASFTVLVGSQGELLGSLAVFMLPVIQTPVVAGALFVSWRIRFVQRRRAGDL